jgi:hypothetical protein
MLEVMRLFRANGYKTYFVTGLLTGNRDFARFPGLAIRDSLA